MIPSLRLKTQKMNIQIAPKIYSVYNLYHIMNNNCAYIMRLILIYLFNLDDLTITSSYNTLLMNYTYKSSEYFQGNQNAT